MHKVYTASCLGHAPFWKALHNSCPSIHFTARWPFLVGQLDNTSADLAANFWQHDLADVQAADTVLVYGRNEDVLRGAICEAGMGIALGKKVYIVGDSPSFSTWQYHPSCVKGLSLIKTLEALGSAPGLLFDLEILYPEYVLTAHQSKLALPS